MRVPSRHLNRFVPHQLLDSLQRDSSHDQAASKGMAKAMPTEIPDLSFQHRLLKPSPDGFPDQRLSIIGDEDPLCMAGNLKLPLEGCQCYRVQGDGPPRSVLCLEQLNSFALEVHLVPGKRKLLRPPHARIDRKSTRLN